MSNYLRIATVVLFAVTLATPASGTVLLSDDFNDGTLSKWDITGRQLGALSVAGVIDWNSSKVGYLSQHGFTEITIENKYSYDPSMQFEFDMEAHAFSPFGPTDDDYAAAANVLVFRDSADTFLGWTWRARATSSNPESVYNTPTSRWIAIGDEAMHSYQFGIQDVLSELPGIDENDIATVTFGFRAYASGTWDSLAAAVFVDNVNVTVVPEPATWTMVLAASGCLMRRRKRQANR